MADEDLQKLVGQTNQTGFWCPMCGSKVLLKDKAIMIEKEVNKKKNDY